MIDGNANPLLFSGVSADHCPHPEHPAGTPHFHPIFPMPDPTIVSIDYELQGVFDRNYVSSQICEAAGAYFLGIKPDECSWSHKDNPPPSYRTGIRARRTTRRLRQGNHRVGSKRKTRHICRFLSRWKRISYDPALAAFAAQNAIQDHDLVRANRQRTADWTIKQTVKVSDPVWLGQNFRRHDWNYIKSLGVYNNQSSRGRTRPRIHSRPPIIDSLELALLVKPDARCVSLRKNYKGKEQATNPEAKEQAISNSGNNPAEDAKECFDYTFLNSQFCKGDEKNGGKKDGGLIQLIRAHPLKPILDFILLRDAPEVDWMKRDWEAVNRVKSNVCNGNRKIGCGQLKGFLCKTNKSFRRLFKSYLKTSPFACAYFVCWLARAKGLNTEPTDGLIEDYFKKEEGNGIFAPHPWIAEHYPQVLHLIRAYQWDTLKGPDTPPSTNLNAWYQDFSERAKGNNYTLKGRYVEVPAGLEHDHYTCPRFPATVLADTAPLNPPERQHNRCRESLECHLESLCEHCKSFHGIHQADVMGRILGFDTKDQSQRCDPGGFTWQFSPSGLYVAPTGFGKSLCYQLPAYIFAKRWKALTVVISPLQALQADQVWGMQRENPRIHVLNEIGEKESNTDETIATETTGAQLATSAKKTDVSDPSFFSIAYYNSTLTSSQKSHIRAAVRGGDCDVIFLAPEQLMNAAVRDMLNCRDIAQVVLDEAHCLSSWGHSFRPSYMYVARWLNDFCEKRLKALGIKTKSPEIALGTNKLTNLSFHHKDTIARQDFAASLPVPRAALFTATIEPAQTEDVKTLFAIDSKDIIGGFSLRPEIELEVHDNALAVPETIQYHSKTKLDHFAFRTGVLHGFLSQEFINNIRFADLPVLVYSVTIRQSELVFGKTHFRPKRISNGQEVYSENLDYGLSQLTGAVNDHLIDIDLKQFAKYEISQIIDEKLNIISFPILESPPTTLQQLIGIIRGIHLLPKTDQKGNRIPFVEAISLTLKRQNNGEVTLRVRPPKNLETLPADTYFHGKVALYHGKMPSHQRKNVMDTFCSGDKNAPNIILCTNAFGLGVDKGDICSVILLGLPTSINELVQQTGRAHRNPAAVIEAAGKDQNRNAPKARAILLTDRMKDVHINEFLLKSNHMSSGTLEQIWYLLHAQWTRRMEMVKRIATGNEEIPQNSNYKEISPEGIIVVDSLTLSSVLNSDQQLDDDQRRTKVDICLYWLERLGLVRRIQDLWESEAYKLPDNDPINTKTPDGKPTELTKLQEDLETIKVWYYLHRLNAKTGLHLLPERFQEALISLDPSLFVGTCFSLEVINKWREEIRKQNLGEENLGEAIDAMRDSKTNAKDTWDKVYKFTIEKLKKLNPTKVNGSPQSKDDFPQSEVTKKILIPFIIGKLIQKTELIPENLDFTAQQHQMLDIQRFLEAQQTPPPQEEKEIPYQLYYDARTMLRILRDLGWVEECNTVTVATTQSTIKNRACESENQTGWSGIQPLLKNYHSRLCGFFEKFVLSDLYSGLENDPHAKRGLRAFYNLIGAASFYGRHLPHAVVKDKPLQCIICRFAKQLAENDIFGLGSTHASLIEISFADILKEESNEWITESIKAIRALDPLYRLTPTSFLRSYLNVLLLHFPDFVHATENHFLLTKTYQLKILHPKREVECFKRHMKDPVPSVGIEGMQSEIGEERAKRIRGELRKCWDHLNSPLYGHNKEKTKLHRWCGRLTLLRHRIINDLITIGAGKYNGTFSPKWTDPLDLKCISELKDPNYKASDLFAIPVETYASELLQISKELQKDRSELSLSTKWNNKNIEDEAQTTLQGCQNYPPTLTYESQLQAYLDHSLYYGLAQLDKLAEDFLFADPHAREELIKENYDPRNQMEMRLRSYRYASTIVPPAVDVDWDGIITVLLRSAERKCFCKILDCALGHVPEIPIPENCEYVVIRCDGAAEDLDGNGNSNSAVLGCGAVVYSSDGKKVNMPHITTKKSYDEVEKTGVSRMICGYQWAPFGGVIGDKWQAESFGVLMGCIIARKLKMQKSDLEIIIQVDDTTWAGNKEDQGGWKNGFQTAENTMSSKLIVDLVEKLQLWNEPVKDVCMQWIPGKHNTEADIYSRQALPDETPCKNIRNEFKKETLQGFGIHCKTCDNPTQPTP